MLYRAPSPPYQVHSGQQEDRPDRMGLDMMQAYCPPCLPGFERESAQVVSKAVTHTEGSQ